MFKKTWESLSGNAIWDLIKTWGWPVLLTISGTLWAALSTVPPVIIACVALFLLVIGWVMVGLYTSEAQSLVGTKTDSTASQGMVAFFPNRTALETRQPIREIFKDGNDIYGYFLSAEGLFSWNPDNIRYMKRIILPKPNGSYLAKLHTLSMNEYLDAPRQIKVTTKTAKARNIEIRWFDDFIGMSLLFCNPEEPSGWVQIELSMPFIEAGNKQAIRIEKSLYPEVFRTTYDAFKKMWDESHSPDPTEYAE